jgi:hypothetical protein
MAVALLWFTLSALCFVAAGWLLYVLDRRRRRQAQRRRQWAADHGFDYAASADIVERWQRGVMATVGDVTARNVVCGQVQGEALFVFDLPDVATVVALHHRIGTEVSVDLRLKELEDPHEPDMWLLGALGPRMIHTTNLDAARRAFDRAMTAFAHAAPRSVEILWNEQHWTVAALPVTSGPPEWDEGLAAVRRFDDLIRVLAPAPRRPAPPNRPLRPPYGRGPQPGVRGVHPRAVAGPAPVTSPPSLRRR